MMINYNDIRLEFCKNIYARLKVVVNIKFIHEAFGTFLRGDTLKMIPHLKNYINNHSIK